MHNEIRLKTPLNEHCDTERKKYCIMEGAMHNFLCLIQTFWKINKIFKDFSKN